MARAQDGGTGDGTGGTEARGRRKGPGRNHLSNGACVGTSGGVPGGVPGGKAHFTMLTSGAMPWMRTSRRSPDSMGPTPAGVPVRITSPGNRVMFVEMKLTR